MGVFSKVIVERMIYMDALKKIKVHQGIFLTSLQSEMTTVTESITLCYPMQIKKMNNSNFSRACLYQFSQDQWESTAFQTLPTPTVS